MVRKVPSITRGQPISAGFLNVMGNNINLLAGALDKPQAKPGDASPKRSSSPETSDQADPNAPPADPNTYNETGRYTSMVRVTNPDDPAQYVDVERIEWVSFVNAAGETLTLVFNN